jgi:hypothetical protein
VILVKRMKRGLATVAIAGLITAGAGVSAAAATPQVTRAPATPAVVEIGDQGIINLILNVNHTLNKLKVLNHVRSIRIVTIDHSLNKLINHSQILSHKVVVLHHFLRNCNVLSCFTIKNFLNKNHVRIGDIVAVELLSHNKIVLFKRP